jgi:hypothetical protein
MRDPAAAVTGHPHPPVVNAAAQLAAAPMLGDERDEGGYHVRHGRSIVGRGPR